MSKKRSVRNLKSFKKGKPEKVKGHWKVEPVLPDLERVRGIDIQKSSTVCWSES